MENYSTSSQVLHNYKTNQELIKHLSDFSLYKRKQNIEAIFKNKREIKSKENMSEDYKFNEFKKLNVNDLNLPTKFEIDLFKYYSSVTIF